MRIKYEAIDIFSGCGGVSCGLSLAGFKIKSAVEIEKHAVDTYLNYVPLSKVKVLNEDICNLSGEQILKAAKIKRDDIYLFAGCPPCQNFSRQNPLNKEKTDDERKKLLFEFLRLIEEILPPFILMENVPGIKTDFNNAILSEFLQRLNKNYYVREDILNAANYGVPQVRKRFVLHAVRKDINKELKIIGFSFDLPKVTHDKKGSFVKILQPDHILEHIKKEIECYVPLLGKTEEQLMDEWLTEEERQLLQKMTPEDNPILMIIDIEPF